MAGAGLSRLKVRHERPHGQVFCVTTIYCSAIAYVHSVSCRIACIRRERILGYSCPHLWGEGEDLVSRRQRGDCRRLFFCAQSTSQNRSRKVQVRSSHLLSSPLPTGGEGSGVRGQSAPHLDPSIRTRKDERRCTYPFPLTPGPSPPVGRGEKERPRRWALGTLTQASARRSSTTAGPILRTASRHPASRLGCRPLPPPRQ